MSKYLTFYSIKVGRQRIAEKTNLLVSADDFIAARKLRNPLVHEYMHDAQMFLESLFAVQQACNMFFAVIEKVETELNRLGMPKTGHSCR